MHPDRRALLTGVGLGVTSLALPAVAAHASTTGPTALVGAQTVAFTSPGYVDLVASMGSGSGSDTSTASAYWHLGYAYVDLAVDGFRLYGAAAANGGGNTTAARISVAPAAGVAADFPDATEMFNSGLAYTNGTATEATFAGATVPAGHFFLISIAGGNTGRGRVDGAPSRIGTVGGQAVVGFTTGYWTSNFGTFDAATLNGFTDGNRAREDSVDRVGWRITVLT